MTVTPDCIREEGAVITLPARRERRADAEDDGENVAAKISTAVTAMFSGQR